MLFSDIKSIYDKCRILPEYKYPEYLKKIYKFKMGRNLNLNKPKTFTEKIQWLKIYDGNLSLKTRLADKLLVRDWVKEKTQLLSYPKIYNCASSYSSLKFSNLPSNFFLKTNHGSNYNIRVENKELFLIDGGYYKVKKLFDKWLSTNYAYYSGFELQYRDIQPKIYAEEQLYNTDKTHLSDYKIDCFNGKPHFIEYFKYTKLLNGKIQTNMAIYDTDWKKQEYTYTQPLLEDDLERPYNFEQMLEVAAILSKDFKFARIDMYEVNKQLYFAEITFTPCSGYMKFSSEKYDLMWGNMLDLN